MQKHVVLTWELGAGYGHIMAFIPLIESLLSKGYKVSLIARNTVTAGNLTRHLPIKIYQAPIYSREVLNKVEVTLSYGDILYNLGYAKQDDLLSLTHAWVNILEFLQADLIIADHSPSSVIAARCLDVKSATYGTGFFIPPSVQPMPSFQALDKLHQTAINKREKTLLKNINGVFKAFKKTPLKQASDIFSQSNNFICTLPEIDHYGETRNLDLSEYAGPKFDIQQGQALNFNDTPGKKIFAYIKEKTADFDKLIQALIEQKNECILHIPDPSAAILEQGKKHKHIRIFATPVKVENMLNNADLIICHAGHGLVSASLLAGVPMLLLPSQLEQSLLAQRLTKQKLVAAINPRSKNNNYKAGIEFALTNQTMKENLKAFQEKYKHLSHHDSILLIVDKCGLFMQQNF